MPVGAKVFRIRKDLNWDLVIINHLLESKYLSGMYYLLSLLCFLLSLLAAVIVYLLLLVLRIILLFGVFLLLLIIVVEYSKVGNYTARPIGHWNIKNIRLFLEKFAKERNLDPLIASSWYNTSLDDIHKVKVSISSFYYFIIVVIIYYWYYYFDI